MNKSLFLIIKWIIDKHGEGILGDPEHLKKVFANYAKDEPKPDRVAFGRCIEMGFYSEMKKARTENERRQIKAELAGKLQKSAGLDMLLCGNTLDLLDATIFGNVAQVQWASSPNQSIIPSSPSANPMQNKYTSNNKNRTKTIGVSVIAVLILISAFAIFNKIQSETKQASDKISMDEDNDEIEEIRKIAQNQEKQLETLKNQIVQGQQTQNTQRQVTQQQGIVYEQANDLPNNALLSVKSTIGEQPPPQIQQRLIQQPLQPQPPRQYWIGDGCSGLRLAVLLPLGKGLTEKEQQILSMIQSSITSDFQKYSAITIIDRQNEGIILNEQQKSLSGIYTDDDLYSIGKLTSAIYLLTGSVTKIANAYMLEFAITNVESGERKASFPPKAVSYFDWVNLSVIIKEASIELLRQLGVNLNEQGAQEYQRDQLQIAQAIVDQGIKDILLQDYDKAITNFTEAIRLNPTYAFAYCNRGYTYLNKKNYNMAISDFTSALRLEANNANTYYNRGVAYENA